MNPSEQPHILRFLTQFEEMKIVLANPILQEKNARGGKYKYKSHTINFPQDFSIIVQSRPWHVEDIDFLIVRRHATQSK